MQPDDKPPCALSAALSENWQPRSLDPPKVEPELETLDTLERSTEVIRYSILTTEYWLSPKGTLREWLRFNLNVLGILGIPGLLIVPAVTCLLSQFVTWTSLLVQIASNLVLFAGTLLIAVFLLSILMFVLRRLIGK